MFDMYNETTAIILAFRNTTYYYIFIYQRCESTPSVMWQRGTGYDGTVIICVNMKLIIELRNVINENRFGVFIYSVWIKQKWKRWSRSRKLTFSHFSFQCNLFKENFKIFFPPSWSEKKLSHHLNDFVFLNRHSFFWY